jgi:hypothetical protein
VRSPAWVVVVELVGSKHFVFAADGPGCRLVLETDCVETREAEASGGNAGLEPSSWPFSRMWSGVMELQWDGNIFTNADRLGEPGSGPPALWRTRFGRIDGS